MLKYKVLLFTLFPLSLLSQSITGKIYDNESTVKGIQVLNITKNTKTLTNHKGEFNISARVNDSLVISSLFYREQSIKLAESHFNDILVVELKKEINKLDEVFLKNIPELKKFEPIGYEANFHAQIKEDMKRRPYLYEPAPSGNIDFVKIFSLIGKLFGKKNQ